MKSDLKGKVIDKSVSGDFYNVYIDQGNPRYPVPVSVSKEVYETMAIGEDVIIPDVVSIPRLSRAGKPFISSFLPK